MRVVAGTLGGRRLATPAGRATRPTSALVRQAIFNSLDARNVIGGADVVDLFAGSGALGIEALSRGAASATFVEEDRRAVAIIRRNLDDLGLADRCTIATTAVERWSPPASVDVVFADPPYDWRGWEELLTRMATFPDLVFVAESEGPVAHAGWQVLSEKRHGGTVVTQLRPRGAT